MTYVATSKHLAGEGDRLSNALSFCQVQKGSILMLAQTIVFGSKENSFLHIFIIVIFFFLFYCCKEDYLLIKLFVRLDYEVGDIFPKTLTK